jgi:NAD(P)-dependent dehydrogenase (short-subunit alcohol dehydrogenase family)
MNLAGKSALVTGAAKRVGRAIAEELARAGANVIWHHHSTPMANGVSADLRDPQAAQFLVDEVVKRQGRLDLLVNSAAG